MATSPDYKVGVIVPGERNPSFNALRFDTIEKARAYGIDLTGRWLLPTAFVIYDDNTGLEVERVRV